MGWKRINGRRYYYRSVREDGRARTEYVGAGEDASLIARLDAIGRDRREAERRAGESDRERADAEDREFADWFDGIEALAAAALAAAGFHRHHRGEWRRRRGRR